jgi:hypothetical protein
MTTTNKQFAPNRDARRQTRKTMWLALATVGVAAGSLVITPSQPARAADVQCTTPYYLASNYSVNSTCSGTGRVLIGARCYKLVWWLFPNAVVRQETPVVNGNNVTVSVGCGYGRGPKSSSDMWIQGY